MNFDTANKTFRHLMANGLTYRVPPFQRDYSWSEDHWDDLWQDITALLDGDAEPAHYMGYLVLQTADGKQYRIIDGQQRMTTLSIMILAALGHLRDLAEAGLDAENNPRRAEHLQAAYIGYMDPVSLVSVSKLELNRHNNRFYQTYLVPLERLRQRGLNASEHLLRKAFGWFQERIKSRMGMSETSGKETAAFIDSLVDKLFFTVIAVYAALRDPGDPVWRPEEKRYLEQLRMFNVRQPLAMLLACHDRFFDAERSSFSGILRAVAVISLRYNVICGMPTHDQERLYNDIAWKISDGTFTGYRQVLNALAAVYPKDERFKGAFAEKELRTPNRRNKKVVRYLLFEIEKQQSGQNFDMESAKYSVEHILPENPSDKWSHIEKSKQDRLIYRLGNMTPLESGKNPDLGNAGYERKRNVYEQSIFRITRAVAEHYDVWDERKIDKRQERLANIAAGIWRIDFGE